MIIFIDAEITANFTNYGDSKEKVININGLFVTTLFFLMEIILI